RSAPIAGDAGGGSARYGGSVPAAEAALGVDDLTGDPGGLVGDQPGDQTGRVVGGAPAALREVAADDFVRGRRGVARVDRAGVDRVQRDAAAGQLVGQGLGDW